ncbi:hypothetical protein FACS1894154_08200 [Betaproteobacteria bacterium]|nr:hypothetical protein FACS1894154_08200 [Betaproteobacteria bacterium]GHU24644.1 hypothetical protein FACS189488_09740 [Betaproteobacteria bacterium]GHU24661.1 hypothetical protein FACS189488_09810 [Betaproteobacteria bacterium]GHU31083.1 hypothetical protein FACS189497_11540 [Betaproteobacteria bacterium]
MYSLPTGFQFGLRGDQQKLAERLRNDSNFDKANHELYYPYIDVLFEANVAFLDREDKQQLVPPPYDETQPGARVVYGSDYTLETITELYAQFSHEEQEGFNAFLQSDELRKFIYSEFLPSVENQKKASESWKRTVDSWRRYNRHHKTSARKKYLRSHRWAKYALCFRVRDAKDVKRYVYADEDGKVVIKFNSLSKPMEQIVPRFYLMHYERILKRYGMRLYLYADLKALKGLVAEERYWATQSSEQEES